MTAPSAARREPPPGGEMVLVVVCGVVLGVAGVVVGGGLLAATLSGGRVEVGVSSGLSVLGGLVESPGDPGRAWGEQASGLPGPWLYWTATLVVAALTAVLVAGLVWGWRRWVSPRPSRFGVVVDARPARPSDLRALVVPDTVPPSGRMLLGRLAPNGPLLATEDRNSALARRHRSARRGDRGSVALIGPTRSGKTVLASAGIVGWDGPVVALSVKRDLFDATAAARARRGELAVFDPGGVTGLTSARWTPLREVTTSSGALRAGRALAQAIPRNGVTGGDFWAAHGETLTSAYMCLAGLSRLLNKKDATRPEPLTIGRLASWAFGHVGVTDPTVNDLIRRGVADGQPLETRLLARDAMTKLVAFDQEDPKIRASIYATARLAFQAWTEPSVAHSASLDPRAHYSSEELWDHDPRYVDLDWLMAGEDGRANTLYLAAPSTEFARLAPVLGGLLGDLREQIHAWDIAGKRMPKPLLIVIDEAGQLELQWLPEEVSTIAGLGGMFVTGWQSRSQISHRYGTLADAVLGGHRSKVFFNGIDDPSTLDYVTKIAGTLHAPQRGWSAEAGGGRRTVSEHAQREDLLPGHLLRQMHPQEAVLVHGTLPPAHLKLIRWWEDKALRELVGIDDDGHPRTAEDVSTCPMGAPRSGQVEPVFDKAVVEETLAHLPPPKAPRQATPVAGEPGRLVRPRANVPGQRHLDLDAAPETPTPPAGADDEAGHDGDAVVVRNTVAGKCERCGTRNEVGGGQTVHQRGRSILVCHPTCPST